MKKFMAVVTLATVMLSFVASAAGQAVAVGMSDGRLVFYYDEVNHSEGTVYSVALAESSSQSPWYSDRASFTKVVFDASFAAYRPSSCQAWFLDLANVVAFEGLENLNVSQTPSLREMFSGCASVIELNLSGFDTANVTAMAYMFENCSSLKTIRVQESFVTSALTDAGNNMFKGCTSLVGGNDTAFSSVNVGKDYARIDRMGYPGYFTCPPTAKAVVKDDSATLRFVYDSRDYGSKGSDWFSVAEAEAINPSKDNVPWSFLGQTVTRVYFDDSFRNYRPSQLGSWFYNFTLLTQINGIKNLDSSEATSMTYMFGNCSGLTTLDLSHFRTANVTDMSWAFWGCDNLVTIDLSEFDTENVTSTRSMFSGCSELVTIYTRRDFDLDNVKNDSDMFKDCTALVGGAGSIYDAAHTGGEYACIDFGTSAPGYFTEATISAVAVGTPDGRLVFYYDNADHTYEGTVYSVAMAESSSQAPWYSARANFTKVVFDASFSFYKPSSCSFWFKDLDNVEAFEGLRYLDTSEVTGMSYMFYGCSSVTELDLANFNTAKVTQMNNMFADCSSLTTIYALDRFVTTAPSFNGNNMFSGCDQLEGGNETSVSSEQSYDATYAKIDEGTQKGYFTRPKLAVAVFDSASKRLTIYYDANNHAAEGMVYYAPGQSVNPAWSSSSTLKHDTTNIVFTTSVVGFRPKSCGSWFNNFRALEGIDGLSYLNVSAATTLNSMFNYCDKLKMLDLTGFDTAKVQNMYHMFAACTSLKTILVSKKFTTASVRQAATPVFTGCTALVGGAGTTYDADNVSAAYARIDGGPGSSSPGYFTEAPSVYVPVAVGTEDGSLIFYYDDVSHEAEGTVYDLRDAGSADLPPWYADRENFTQVVIDESFDGYSPQSCRYWFKGFVNVESFEGLGWINVNYLSLEGMFEGCVSLTELDLSDFRTSFVISMRDMFKDCESLTTIYALDYFSLNYLLNPNESMFDGCISLVGGSGTEYDASKVDSSYAKVDDGGQVGYFTRATMALAVHDADARTLTFYYDGLNHHSEGTVYYVPGQLPSSSQNPPWGKVVCSTNVMYVVFDDTFADFRPQTCYNWFRGFAELEDIGGIGNLDVSETTRMEYMFYGCSKLKRLDLSGFDTANVTKMGYMFNGCGSLEAIYVSSLFTTNALQKASLSVPMFLDCTNLVGGAGTAYDGACASAAYAHLDGGVLNPGYFAEVPTAKVVVEDDGATLRFVYDSADYGEEGVDWYCYYVGDYYGDWHDACADATKAIFASSFAAYRPVSLAQLFSGFAELKSIEGLVNLNTSATIYFGEMFYGCESLMSLDLSGFDTSKAESMSGMFGVCAALQTLDVSSFDTSAVTDMYGMFSDCTRLRTIYATSSFVTYAVEDSDSMFANSESLVGGAGTVYDGDHDDKEYARIDGTPAMTHEGTLPGYFTDKAAQVGYGAWAESKGLTGADAAWDAKPALWGGKWANAFIYTFGEGLVDGSIVIVDISFDEGEPVITTAPVVAGHTDFNASVIGTEDLQDWTTAPVELERSGNDWILPFGETANFFRVQLIK